MIPINNILRIKLKNKSSYKKFIKNLISDIFQSIRGKQDYDYTSGSLPKAVFLLSIPMILEMLMESIFAITDIYYVSHLGAEAVATIGLTESIISLVYAIGIGLSMGTTAIIARRIGEKRFDLATISGVQAIFTAFIISLFIAIPGILFSEALLELMGASKEMLHYAIYTRWMLGGNAIIMFLFVINAIFRSAGDAAISLRVLILANVLNMILDPMLIFGFGPIPAMGIEGAAIASNSGRGLAVVYQMYLLFRGSSRIHLKMSHFTINARIIIRLIKLSAGGFGQMLIATSSWIFLTRIIAEFGSSVLAGYTIAIRIIVFILLPSLGVSNAASTLVGQNLGAGKPMRAQKAVAMAALLNVLIMAGSGIALILFPDYLIRFFIEADDVVRSGAQALRIISYGLIAYGLGMVLVNALNGAGDTINPTRINFIAFWIIEIPLAWLLSHTFKWEQAGVFYAIIISESLMTLMAFYIFRKGLWKTKVV